jgi:hypothetical protein
MMTSYLELVNAWRTLPTLYAAILVAEFSTFGFASGNVPAFMRRLIDDSDIAKSTSKSAILTFAESGSESKFCIDIDSVMIILRVFCKVTTNHKNHDGLNHFNSSK